METGQVKQTAPRRPVTKLVKDGRKAHGRVAARPQSTRASFVYTSEIDSGCISPFDWYTPLAYLPTKDERLHIMPMADILFIRHGQTQANVIGRWEGWTDPGLTPAGRNQARSLARCLVRKEPTIEAIYTSPLRRAYRTAKIIGTDMGLDPLVVEGLKEIHFGNLEGVSLTEMAEAYPELHARWQDKSDMGFQWPGGEQRSEFFRRVTVAWRRIYAPHPHGTIAVVAHGGTIRVCLAHLLPRVLGQWWGYGLDNTGLTRVRVAEEGARLIVLNDTSHLSREAMETDVL